MQHTSASLASRLDRIEARIWIETRREALLFSLATSCSAAASCDEGFRASCEPRRVAAAAVTAAAAAGPSPAEWATASSLSSPAMMSARWLVTASDDWRRCSSTLACSSCSAVAAWSASAAVASLLGCRVIGGRALLPRRGEKSRMCAIEFRRLNPVSAPDPLNPVASAP